MRNRCVWGALRRLCFYKDLRLRRTRISPNLNFFGPAQGAVLGRGKQRQEQTQRDWQTEREGSVCVCLIRPEREDRMTPKRLILLRSCCLYGNSQFGQIVRPVFSTTTPHHPPTHTQTHTPIHPHSHRWPGFDWLLVYQATLTLMGLLVVGCFSWKGNNNFTNILFINVLIDDEPLKLWAAVVIEIVVVLAVIVLLIGTVVWDQE